MKIQTAINFRPFNAENFYLGQCHYLNASRISFISKVPLAVGIGVEIKIIAGAVVADKLVFFAKTHQSNQREAGDYEIIARIKSIKATH